jgi:hypothetical protein
MDTTATGRRRNRTWPEALKHVAETIEIDLAGKYRVRISGGVDPQVLRRVLDVLERR